MYKNRNCIQLTNSNLDPGSIVQWRIIIPLISSRVPVAKLGQRETRCNNLVNRCLYLTPGLWADQIVTPHPPHKSNQERIIHTSSITNFYAHKFIFLTSLRQITSLKKYTGLILVQNKPILSLSKVNPVILIE